MNDVREQMTATRSLLEAARRDAERALHRLEKAEAKVKQRADIVEAYKGGQTSVKKLAEEFGTQPEAVRSALKEAGVYTPQRRGKVSEEKRLQIVAALGDNPSVSDQALAWGLSAATIRKIGQDAGVIAKGAPRTPRTEQQMQDIKLIDTKLREEYNAGLTALGTALTSWEKNRMSAPEALALKTAGTSSTPDGAPWE